MKIVFIRCVCVCVCVCVCALRCVAKTCAVSPFFARVVGELRAADLIIRLKAPGGKC